MWQLLTRAREHAGVGARAHQALQWNASGGQEARARPPRWLQNKATLTKEVAVVAQSAAVPLQRQPAAAARGSAKRMCRLNYLGRVALKN